jgi:hypothetical protein
MLKREDNTEMENQIPSSEAPRVLRVAIENLMLEATEELDPLISLMITNLTVNITDIVYTTGKRDGYLTMGSSELNNANLNFQEKTLAE